jgi:mono/diheme cytochrome c family protein
MFQEFKSTRIVASAIIATIAIASSLQHAAAEDDPTEIAAATVDEQYSEHKMDVKRLFASRCSWCHQGYGMKRADGPQLAGTSKNRDQVINTIAKGKSPMPGFRKQLKPYQMEALADYIMALPAE